MKSRGKGEAEGCLTAERIIWYERIYALDLFDGLKKRTSYIVLIGGCYFEAPRAMSRAPVSVNTSFNGGVFAFELKNGYFIRRVEC